MNTPFKSISILKAKNVPKRENKFLIIIQVRI